MKCIFHFGKTLKQDKSSTNFPIFKPQYYIFILKLYICNMHGKYIYKYIYMYH